MKNYKILVINPGSTSTKLSFFINEVNQCTEDIFHDSSLLKTFPSINDQLDFRMKVVDDFIEKNQLDLSDLDAIASRGGPCYAVVSGTYEVNDQLIQDTKESKGGLYHASMLGVQMAKRVQMQYGGIMLMSDPTVVDEYSDLARVSGVDGIYRRAICHALNVKAVARKYAQSLNKRYEDLNLIVCHIDGGITITAHEHGRMVDGNDGGGGEGPFTPTRIGSMAVTDVIRYLWDQSKEDMLKLCSVSGGLSNYFNTSNTDVIHHMVEQGDVKATRVWNAMIYQICKYIGSMSTVLKGDVDGIVLTGGLMRFKDVYEQIKERCSWISDIVVYEGEYEQEALALGALRVLRGEEKPRVYAGHAVWDGFKD